MFRLTNKAYEDLKEIAVYTHEIWGASQRDIYMRMLDSAFHVIVANPSCGLKIDEIREGYYKYVIGKHLIFYRVVAGEIEIVRILHQRMDVESYI